MRIKEWAPTWTIMRSPSPMFSSAPRRLLISIPVPLQATNPNGYWQLNMNQACYEGSHLHKWTPIGERPRTALLLPMLLATGSRLHR